jgi:adenylylsulfate kinase
MVIWIVGLSGAGKTTIARLLLKKLKKKYTNLVHLDGDIIRKIYNDKLGYSSKDRNINAERLSKMTKFLSDQKIHVVGSVLSNFPKWQAWNKKNIKNYYQVYLKVSLKELIKRDKKNIYKKALKGTKKNVVGVDIKFKEPLNSNLIIDNEKYTKSFSSIINKIIKKTRI